MSVLINDGETIDDNDMQKCDVGQLILHVEKIKNRIQIISKMAGYIKSIIQWKRPIVTIFWMSVFCFAIIINPIYLFIAFIIPIPPFMLVELLRSVGKKPVPERRYQDLFERKDNYYHQILKYEEQVKRKERLNKYVETLMLLQNIFKDINLFFDSIESILKWKHRKVSFLLMTMVVLVEFSLYFFDIRFLLIFMVLVIFFVNKYLYRVILNLLTKLKTGVVSLTKYKTVVANEKLMNAPVDIIEEANKENQSYDVTDYVEDMSSSSESDEDVVDVEDINNSSAYNHHSSKASKQGTFVMSKFFLRPLHRRNKIAETCSSCYQPCSSILNKRRYCRHCGKSFCAKCCHKSVPRSFLGATAPAAHQEKVLVCMSCHAFVTNRFNSTPSEIVL
ncbi:protrudin isoform X1 [Hydra vulgaris]|nr:protrudin isoform X1 [Hydra vulgaris]